MLEGSLDLPHDPFQRTGNHAENIRNEGVCRRVGRAAINAMDKIMKQVSGIFGGSGWTHGRRLFSEDVFFQVRVGNRSKVFSDGLNHALGAGFYFP